jgi:hypothetical protein
MNMTERKGENVRKKKRVVKIRVSQEGDKYLIPGGGGGGGFWTDTYHRPLW